MTEVALQQPRVLTDKPDHATLLEQALTMPGSLGKTYRRFFNYSTLNCLLLYMQGAAEPVNTMKRWNDMDHHVIKGSKAYSILRPIIGKVVDEYGKEDQALKGFKMVKCLFTASQTEGPELPPAEPVVWDKVKALGALGLAEVPFDNVDGNLQGWSNGEHLAINPVARYPLKTMVHEIAHCVLKHGKDGHDYQAHRGVSEFQAEGTAYVVMNELDLQEHMDMGESRAYIQDWLRGERPGDAEIRPIFGAVDKILMAGRVES